MESLRPTRDHPMVALGGRPDPVAADEVALRARKARVFGSLFEKPAVRRFDRYVVLDTLGQGGIGTVLKVYDEQLDRAVALKLLRRERTEAAADRLRREAQALAQLSHPHVVQVYEVGRAEGQTFIAMELVKGQTLAQWARREPRPSWREIVQVYRQAGDGLAAAHAKGIVHRDFKPSNALVDDQGRVRVLDFGLARQFQDRTLESGDQIPTTLEIAAAGPPPSLTPSGAVLGTPGYMPLEQMRGHEVDARSDQFSFCVSLWEAIYADRPFAGRTLRALIDAMESSTIRPAPRGVAAPSKLRAVLLRGLAADPRRRWPSMEALLTELQSLVTPRGPRFIGLGLFGGLIVVGVGLGVSSVLDRLERCTGAWAQLAGIWDDARRQQVEDAVVGTGLGYAPDVWERAVQPMLDDYAGAWVIEYEAACEATSVRRELSAEVMDRRMVCLDRARRALHAAVRVLATADADVVANAHEVVGGLHPLSRCADVEALAADVEPPLPEDVERVEEIRELLARAKAERGAGRYAMARAQIDDAKERLVEIGYGPVRTEALLEEGEVLEDLGQYEESQAVLRRALGSASRWRQWGQMQRAADALMFVVGAQQHRVDEGLRYRELAIELAPRSSAAEASSRNSLAGVLRNQGKYEEAEEQVRRALALWEQALGPEHPSVALAHNGLANVLAMQGRFEEAQRVFRQALALWERALGTEHPSVASAHNGLANVLAEQGRYVEAQQEYQRALGIWQRALGVEHPNLAVVRDNLAAILYTQGRYDAAVQAYRRALSLRRQTLAPEDPRIAISHYHLATALVAQGSYEEAEPECRRSLALLEEMLGPEHPDVAMSRNLLGVLLGAQGRHEEAEQELRRALALRHTVLGPEHLDVAWSRVDLAEELLVQGRAAEARRLAELAWVRLQRARIPAGDQAIAAFVLARTLWPDRVQRPWARELALLARDGLVAQGKGEQEDLTRVEQWLKTHRL